MLRDVEYLAVSGPTTTKSTKLLCELRGVEKVPTTWRELARYGGPMTGELQECDVALAYDEEEDKHIHR